MEEEIEPEGGLEAYRWSHKLKTALTKEDVPFQFPMYTHANSGWATTSHSTYINPDFLPHHRVWLSGPA